MGARARTAHEKPRGDVNDWEKNGLYSDRFFPAMNENNGPELARITVYVGAGRIRVPWRRLRVS